ncbi:hypothetical protein Halhy_6555 (plasmid) [Haliscomenobacter hydrossis DSM 1100]|uniref:Uncharacterized protein n=1 Tax=Haliscomenobacter hydrossis (strain ATCC 27775 / DSM 1100 / LMG 10767 / O) TaxID=760192 RepID=F4L7L3_HALH1|nr:hypothetical protein Halhy_6555 [Haliscomenobacter hydrossis DSM 1100]
MKVPDAYLINAPHPSIFWLVLGTIEPGSFYKGNEFVILK